MISPGPRRTERKNRAITLRGEKEYHPAEQGRSTQLAFPEQPNDKNLLIERIKIMEYWKISLN